MKIAAAQIKSKIGDIEGNFKKHLELINLAAHNKVNLIVFPEMSLTGYCRKQARSLTIRKSDQEIIDLSQKAILNNLTIIVGGPIDIKGRLYIGSYLFSPDGNIKIYTKQYLHTGEEVYFSSSFNYNPIIKIKDEIISFAICADIDHYQHAKTAKANKCSLYLASIFYTESGINEGHKLLSKYAQEYSFSVLMSNYSGEVWNTSAGGRSGFWDKNGKLVAELEPDKEGLLILEKQDGIWTKKSALKLNSDVQLH